MNLKKTAWTTFLLLIALHLGLAWLNRYVPTQDGPSHLANAVILRNLLLPGETGVEHCYHINRRLIPNWTYYAAVAPLAAVIPPRTAERVFLSVYILGFAFAFYKLAKAAGATTAIPAIAAAPFVLSLPFHLGFLNYCLGVVMMLAALAYFWRRRDRLGWKEALVIDILAVATYFCHVVPALLLLGYVYLLLLALSLPGRNRRGPPLARRRVFALATLPAWILPAFYFGTTKAARFLWINPGSLFQYLIRGWPLETFNQGQRVVGVFAVAVAAAALIGTGVRILSRARPWPQARDAFGVAALASLLLYFVVPDSGFGGGAISVRLAVFPFLFVFVWAGDDFGRVGRKIAFAAAAVLALSSWVGNLLCYRTLSRSLAELRFARAAVEPGSSFVFLDFGPKQHRVDVFRHAGAYFTLDGDVLDLGNYEGHSRDFPVNYREHCTRPPRTEIAEPETYDVDKYAPVVDYVVAWDMPASPRSMSRFEKSYELVFERPRLKVFKVRGAAAAEVSPARAMKAPFD